MRETIFIACLCVLDVDLFDYRERMGTCLYDDASGGGNACYLSQLNAIE